MSTSLSMATDAERNLIVQRALADGPPETVQPPNRLSVHPQKRVLMACTAAGMIGAALGVSHGANVAGLEFRAENAHRLPTSQQGWFLYHKSKNYAVMLGGVREAARMSARLAAWTSLFLLIEEIVDRSRQSRDALSTLCAGLTTAGAFSLYNRLPMSTAARMTSFGITAGLTYGLAQDGLALLQGKPVGYVETVRRISRSARPET